MINTASRRRDDIIIRFEIFHEQAVRIFGVFLEPGIGHGLTTASLVCRIKYVNAQFFQKLHGGYPYLGIKLVDITRYKKGYFQAVLI